MIYRYMPHCEIAYCIVRYRLCKVDVRVYTMLDVPANDYVVSNLCILYSDIQSHIMKTPCRN
jgi:hypothetical protein